MVFGIDDLAFASLVGTGAGVVTSLIGGEQARKNANTQFDNNARLQREFAQHGISWKVADARRAGIHPLAALGVPPMSPSPVHVQGQDSGITAAGAAVQGGLQEYIRAEIANKNAETAKIKAEAESLKKSGQNVGPKTDYTVTEEHLGPYPATNPGYIFTENEITAPEIGKPDTSAGPAKPFYDEYLKDGYLFRYPNKDIMDFISEDLWAKGEYYINKAIDWLMAKSAKEYPRKPAPHGTKWEYNHHRRQWYAAPLKRYKIPKK